MPISHAFHSAVADEAASGRVRPSEWNAGHVVNIDLTTEVSGILPVANGGTGTSTPSFPASSTDNAIARFDGTTGKLLQNSLLQVTDLGQLRSPAGGAYVSSAVMLSNTSGIVTTGSLPFNEPLYISGGGDYNMVYGDPLSGAMQSANGLRYGANYNGIILNINDGDAFTDLIGVYQFADKNGQDSYRLYNSNQGADIYRLTDFGIIKSNDPYGSRLGNVFNCDRNGVGGDATVNIYQEGSGANWLLLLDKSDVDKLRINDVDGIYAPDLGATLRNIDCLNVTASNAVIGNSVFSYGAVIASSSFEGPDIFFTGLATPSLASNGFFWYDTDRKANQTFAAGIKQTVSTSLLTQTADKTVANTTTETSIVGTGVGNLTLPANFFVAGKTIRITMSGVYSTVAVTGDTVTIKIKYGSTVLASKATTALVTGGTNLAWWADAIITCRTTGSSGTVQVSGGIRYQIAGSTIVEDELNNGVATTTLNTTTSNLLDVTVTHGAANAANSVKSLVGAFEVLN